MHHKGLLQRDLRSKEQWYLYGRIKSPRPDVVMSNPKLTIQSRMFSVLTGVNHIHSNENKASIVLKPNLSDLLTYGLDSVDSNNDLSFQLDHLQINCD